MYILLPIYYFAYIKFKPLFKKIISFVEHQIVILKQNVKHNQKKIETKAQHEKKKKEIMEKTYEQIKEINEKKEKKIKEIDNKYSTFLSRLESIKEQDKFQEFLNNFFIKN